jgi:CubicO group peptidase (beta-lactamase class C family)
MTSYLLVVLLGLATSVPAPTPSPTGQGQEPSDSLPAAGRPPLTREDLEIFLAGFLPRELERNDVAGAVIAVVKDGQLLLAKGYGYSDVAKRMPVSPDSTVFRVASISKLFTATAVMQLVEQGKLDLDTDIAEYLDFTFRRRFPGPITLRHILTHTTGFEESFKQVPADSGKSVPLRVAVASSTPAQIYPPGTVTAYSNYAVDLAGYIVERVSGTPFPDYVRINILEPLGMRHSSFAEPLPPNMKAMVSKEYAIASDSADEFEILQGEPSGNLSSTARDMAQFMIAHLALGRYGDTRILREETARRMAERQFRTHPDVNGMALGFFEESRNGYRMIGHGGDLSRFHSHLGLLMDERVGYFFSVNSSGSGAALYGVREAFQDAFLNRYFPSREHLAPVVADAKREAAMVTGPYQLSRRPETTMLRAMALLLPLKVGGNDDGSIQIPLVTGPNGQPVRWYPIGSRTFRNPDGSQRIAFTTDSATGMLRMAFLGGHELHQLRGLDRPRFNLWLLTGGLAIMVGTLLLWPVAGLVRRRFRQAPPEDGVSRRLRAATRIAALLNLLFLAAFGIFFYLVFNSRITPDSRLDPVLRVIQLLGVLGIAGAAVVLIACAHSWRRGTNRWSRLKYTALVLACLSLGWFAVHWNLLVWNLDY